ncbi:DUF2231 domain-containing protein [Planosporangium mesophilum]|uniref:DUF2231 domain-containing protein n=1 Tax=Planosporangium mesophilum TaxID=689768 RepID=A0A8J3T7T8_9ACTN|nr:DUF2231 domain-containing protein [Planosporangium mesophilum]NJC82690.1 hypothetical protein [Planosporangium mesophilum]GII21838.1 hypothetical protein Pme01_14350 [Planosporangium mesophilum]
MTTIERRTRQEAIVPDSINGLPLHPLVVHAVVVLLPLACLGVIAVALRSSWRARYGGIVVALATLATLAIPVATHSGEQLALKVGDPGQHAVLGDRLLWFALPLLVAAVALYVLGRRGARAGSESGGGAAVGGSSALTLAVAAVAVIVAGANLVQVYRVGDSGARAVWQGVQNVPSQNR